MECTFKYKCRQCGEIFDGATGGRDPAHYGLMTAMYKLPFPKKFIGIHPDMLESHTCKNNFIGIGDLIGYSMKDK